MISAEEARGNVDRRMKRIASESGAERSVSDVGLLCSGTDVRGPDLQHELNDARAEFVAYIAAGTPAGTILNGLLVRTFWLGYEFGAMTRFVGKLIALYALYCAVRGPRYSERDAWFELERLLQEGNAIRRQRRDAAIYASSQGFLGELSPGGASA